MSLTFWNVRLARHRVLSDQPDCRRSAFCSSGPGPACIRRTSPILTFPVLLRLASPGTVESRQGTSEGTTKGAGSATVQLSQRRESDQQLPWPSLWHRGHRDRRSKRKKARGACPCGSASSPSSGGGALHVQLAVVDEHAVRRDRRCSYHDAVGPRRDDDGGLQRRHLRV